MPTDSRKLAQEARERYAPQNIAKARTADEYIFELTNALDAALDELSALKRCDFKHIRRTLHLLEGQAHKDVSACLVEIARLQAENGRLRGLIKQIKAFTRSRDEASTIRNTYGNIVRVLDEYDALPLQENHGKQ